MEDVTKVIPELSFSDTRTAFYAVTEASGAQRRVLEFLYFVTRVCLCNID